MRSKRAIVRITNEEEPGKNNHRRKTNSRRVLQAKHKGAHLKRNTVNEKATKHLRRPVGKTG